MTAIRECRICRSRALEQVIDLGWQALTGIFPRSVDEEVPWGPLVLCRCADCGLVQLGHSYDLKLMYGGDYGYRSGLNPAMVEHLRSRVRHIDQMAELRVGDVVVDIGSNDGTLLGAYSAVGLHKIGIDPTAGRFQHHYPDGVNIIPEFFSAAAISPYLGDRKARAVTSIAMFYDLEQPLEFVREVRDILADDGVWMFEQSYLPAMVAANAYDTICHEHLEYYTVERVRALLELYGLKIIGLEFNDTNGGSFCVMAAKKSAAYAEPRLAVERAIAAEGEGGYGTTRPLKALAERVVKQRETLLSLLNELKAQGKTVLGYGASTKGNVLLQYCGIGPDLLPAIAEINESKFGRTTPGTRIPIISEDKARAMKPDAFLVLPWHFREGIVEREAGFLRNGGKLIFPLPDVTIEPPRLPLTFGVTPDDLGYGSRRVIAKPVAGVLDAP